ncbi:MAG: PQQ-binding-like beta-propeller repeat protein, partial [Armatimonadota bacterium]|nr:PQQ-binding-like beta-propeller repeat protein [Armatimonadota bacterium]
MAGQSMYGVPMMRYLLVGLFASALMLLAAQDSWHTHRGSEQRTGTTDNARNRAVSLLLAWTYPSIESVRAPLVVDNDSTLASATGEWIIPSRTEQAADPYRANPDTAVPYQYAFGVREERGAFDEFTWRSGALPVGYYRIYVYIPATPTRLQGRSVLNASRAEYVVVDSLGNTTPLYLDQTVGGWRPLGERSFYHNGSPDGIKVTLRNVIRRDSPDYELQEPVIVVADAVRFVPDYGTVQASPVAIRSPLDPARHLVYIANGNGTLTCIENPIDTREARVRWTLRVPDLPEQVQGTIYTTRDDFTPGAFVESSGLADAYSPSYYEIEPTDDQNNIQRAYWKVRVPSTGEYYVEAWFPSDPENARQAEYVIEHQQGELRVRVDQRFGGRWVRLNNTPVQLRAGTTYEIAVNNYSPSDVTIGARRVIADAIRLLRADGLDRGIYSTPAVGQVRIRDGASVVTRWVVFFGAQNGAIYAVDALGDGENGTPRGETKIYWIIKPRDALSFGYASPLIIGNDRVVIGNSNGSVYVINTALNPDDPDTYFFWEYKRPGAAFVSTPAYSPDTRLVYIGSIEGGNLFGRLIALDPFRRDDPNTNVDERVAWTYPKEQDRFVEPVTATPAVALGRVYFTTGGLDGGRLYAVDARTGQLVWAQPRLEAPRIPQFGFFYSSPLVVPGVIYNSRPTNIVYVAGEIGFLIAFDADNGQLLYISESLGAAVYSSPIFTNIQDTDVDGNVLAARPAVVVTTNEGRLLALHADNLTNARNGKAFEGWDLYAETVFASPGVLDGWLYAADDDGIVYAFNVQGVAAAPPESGLGEVIRDPTRSTTQDGGDYSKLRVSVTTKKEEADAAREGRLPPERVSPVYPTALEWGDRIYVIAWNFRQG